MYSQIYEQIEIIITKALSQIDPEYQTRGERYIIKSRQDIKYTIDLH